MPVDILYTAIGYYVGYHYAAPGNDLDVLPNKARALGTLIKRKTFRRART